MIRYYYEDKCKSELDTVITNISVVEGKCFVELEDSIYYPQGGGQKGDRGVLEIEGNRYNIKNTVKDENHNSLLLMEDELDSSLIGKTVKCYLDTDFRTRQMKLHTCLHIYHVLIEQVKGSIINNPKLSTIEDGFAVNRYDETEFDATILDEVTANFMEIIKQDIKVETYPDDNDPNFRYWKCMDRIIPCGGIHVDSLKDIGDVEVEVSHKKKAISTRIILK